MQSLRKYKLLIPAGARPYFKGLLSRLGYTQFKYDEELGYWRRRFIDGKWTLEDYYAKLMTFLAKESSDAFLTDKTVADFGCGPRGSLNWVTTAKHKIGIDVLAQAYAEFDIEKHDMIYVVCSEEHIPIPDNYIDVMFTMNALDHTAHLNKMCQELIRVIKPGGELIASFNLGEAATLSEPQTLTEAKLEDLLLKYFNPIHKEQYNDNNLMFRGQLK